MGLRPRLSKEGRPRTPVAMLADLWAEGVVQTGTTRREVAAVVVTQGRDVRSAAGGIAPKNALGHVAASLRRVLSESGQP